MAEVNTNLRDLWSSQDRAFIAAMRAGAGFSFIYQGRRVGADFSSKDWCTTPVTSTAESGSSIVFEHTSGLQVTRVSQVMRAFDAIEYRLLVKNAGSQPLETISALHALSLTFDESVCEDTSIIASGGGLADGFLPPRTFTVRECLLSSVTDLAVSFDLQAEGGRSSNRDLPFFLVHNKAKKEGMFVAIGWSGQWAAATFLDQNTRTLLVSAKIPDIEIALQPSEEIQGPTILLGHYKGEWRSGSNRLRRLIREKYTPKLAGKEMQPIATYDTWFGVNLEFDESLLRRLADGAAAVGQEYLLLDAGWYAGTEGNFNFSSGVGNWFKIDQTKLPNGIKPVAEYVRSRGLKFGLWFEPERVAAGSQLAEEHSDWVLWEQQAQPSNPESWWRDLYPDLFNRAYGLLDYGRPEVQVWVREMMDHYIRDCGIRYIRYDFNLNPLPYWNAKDTPNRRGMTQLRHIQGFYSVIDWIRESHPQVVLEGCASGGRRIDLETVRRFHTAWISDHTANPAIVRYHLHGINNFLPGSHHYVLYALPSVGEEYEAKDINFQSMFAGAFGIAGRLDLWSDATKHTALKHVEAWKKIRRYLLEDYYPLSSQPSDLESWSGWQFHDPIDNSGFVQTFRTNTTDDEHRFVLQGLDARGTYRFVDIYDSHAFEVSGAGAVEDGVTIAQAPMSSRLFVYSKLRR